MKVTNEFWYYLIVIVSMTVNAFILGIYINRQDFLNDAVWALPVMMILSVTGLFALEEIKMIIYERKEKITASFRKSG